MREWNILNIKMRECNLLNTIETMTLITQALLIEAKSSKILLWLKTNNSQLWA